MAITGHRKIAALLLNLDPEAAAKILQNLHEDHLATVGIAMADLEEGGYTQEDTAEVLKEFRRQLIEGGWEVGTPFEELLVKGLGPEGSSKVLERMRRERTPRHPFAVLEKLSGEELQRTLRAEHPQIVAFVLANIGAAQAGEVLAGLEDEERSDILLRIARLEGAPLPNVDAVIETLNRRGAAATGTFQLDTKSRLRGVAEILNSIEGGAGKGLMDRMSEVDPETTEAIREMMFTFEDLGRLDARGLQKILSSVDVRQLATALKGVDVNLQEQILGNVSKRVRESVVEEKEFLGPLPFTEVQEARREVTRIARGLIEGGEISLPRGRVEQLVE
jgi:flagellar motor switch protein FliG